jgi:hypothetical protein
MISYRRKPREAAKSNGKKDRNSSTEKSPRQRKRATLAKNV